MKDPRQIFRRGFFIWTGLDRFGGRADHFQMRITLLLSTIVLSACSSAPKLPDWTQHPTREVDGGYIVYIGIGEASNADRAQFKAEGQALEDLANECSMIPKGARIEDRFVQKNEHDSKAFVKLGLEFQECEQAKRTNDPNEIQKVASAPFTQQLKRYQDLEETGEMPGEVAQVEPPREMAPPPVRAAGWDDRTHFFVMRQYVAYQKEIVVLAPPNYYAANASATKQFVNTVQPTAEQIHGIQEKAPDLRKQAWSQVPNRPPVTRPAGLAAKPQPAHAVHPPSERHPREERHQRAHADHPKRKRGKHEHR